MRRIQRLLCLVALGAAVGLASPTLPTGVAGAQSDGNGLEEQSVNSFEFDPSAGVIRVTIDITLRNVTTDQVDGNVINRTYWDSYGVTVLSGAENIVATLNGSVLDGTLVTDPEFPAYDGYDFRLGTRLYSGQSTTVQVTYEHRGAEPRSEVPWRVNEAYTGFAAFGLGDEGSVTVRIAQPAGYDFDEGTDLSSFEPGEPNDLGNVVYESVGITENDTITVGLSNDDRLVSRELDVDGVDITLRSWPNDPEWADFAAERVEAGIPALEDLLLSPWSVAGSFEVRQSVDPIVAGYAGWFDLAANEIAVGEALDAVTIYHELSHAWFNYWVTEDRWFTEGLAEVYAVELVRRDGDTPPEPVEPSSNDVGALPLAEWTDFESDFDVEDFGYSASFWVVNQLVSEIGFERTADVVNRLDSTTSPYDGEPNAERPRHEWQRIYDMLVEVGGATTAGDLFRAHVVGAADAPMIAERDAAAAEVAALSERGEPWKLPAGVRHSLETWNFRDTTDSIAVAEAVLDRRDELEALEEVVGVEEADRAGRPYSTARRDANGVVDLSRPMELLDESVERGERLVARQQEVDVLAVAAAAEPPPVGMVDGVDDFASALEATDAQLAVLERVVEVDGQLDDASGLLAAVGRLGSNAQGELDQARSEVEAGDNDLALATLDTAEAQIDDLATDGAIRLAIVGAIALLLLALALLVRRRRRSRPTDPDDITDYITGQTRDVIAAPVHPNAMSEQAE